jgi:hypothetical protein
MASDERPDVRDAKGPEKPGLVLQPLVSVVETYRRLKISVRDYLASILPG